MANDVFVNGLEVACKAADGKSVAAFPDPCWSPPPPKGGPIVIPYANTAYARDLTNATKTVMITDKPVAQRDKSYFKTSTGNEAATNAFAKGYISHVITGRAYFRSWSMNVFVEGYNVCRHTDLMTHNHGSDPGNTGVWRYLDTRDVEKPCKEDKKRVETECGVTKDENKEFQKQIKRRNEKRERHNELIEKGKRKGRKKKSLKVREKTWKDKHCKGLLITPDTNAKNIEKKFDEIKEEMEKLRDDFIDALPEKARKAVEEKGKSYASRTLVKHTVSAGCAILGPISALVCQGVALVTDVVDGVLTVGSMVMDAADNAVQGYKLYKQVSDYGDYVEEVKKALENPEEMEKFRKKLLDDMKKAVDDNKCLQARKCMLVPYKKKTDQGKLDKKQVAEGKGKTKGLSERLGLGDERGCCPGQTRHHLIPRTWMKGCSGYNDDKAPTVCVEGTTQNDGTHKVFHNSLNDVAVAKGLGEKEIEKTIDIAAEGHQAALEDNRVGVETFWGNSICDIGCIKAQLTHYYKQFNCTPNVQEIPLSSSDEESGGM